MYENSATQHATILDIQKDGEVRINRSTYIEHTYSVLLLLRPAQMLVQTNGRQPFERGGRVGGRAGGGRGESRATVIMEVGRETGDGSREGRER